MKDHEISILGKIDSSGELWISNLDEMNQFLKAWPNQQIIMVAKVYPQKGSKQLIGYYMAKVVPDFQKIFKEHQGEVLSKKETDEKLREMSPVMHEEIPEEEAGGFELARVRNVYEVSYSELWEHVEFVRMIAARDYETHIHDPAS
jgi:hypothetical protein